MQLLLAVGKDKCLEGVENEKVEWRTYPGNDMLRFVAVVLEGKE